MTAYQVEHIFHPVGHGGFNTGVIWSDSDAFSFVYDCGGGKASHRNRCIDKFLRSLPRSKIDLLAISHFDTDHVAGLHRLLSGPGVDTILLPYAPLSRRLFDVMARGGALNADDVAFYVNPAAWLAERYPEQVRRVVFVLAGPLEDDDPREDLSPARDPSEGGAAPDAPGPLSRDENGFVTSHSPNGPRTEYLEPGDIVQPAPIWRLVPYNDAKWRPKTPAAFEKSVRNTITDLSSGSRIEAAIEKLNKAYDKNFGSTSHARNRISLFLLSTHMDVLTETGRLVVASGKMHVSRTSSQTWRREPFREGFYAGIARRPLSFLFTGDGDLGQRLKTHDPYPGFKAFFGALLERPLILQAPHHGSQHNWRKGLTSDINTVAVVFCAPRYGGKHPHPTVVRDCNNVPHACTGVWRPVSVVERVEPLSSFHLAWQKQINRKLARKLKRTL